MGLGTLLLITLGVILVITGLIRHFNLKGAGPKPGWEMLHISIAISVCIVASIFGIGYLIYWLNQITVF